MKKKMGICLAVIMIILASLTACGPDTTQLAKDEFARYHNGKDEVVLIIEDSLFFENHKFDLSKFKTNEEPNNGLLIEGKTLYFTTCVEDAMFGYILNVYKSDFLGKNSQLIYSKSGYKTHPWVYGINGIFYVEHYSKNAFLADSKLIDSYCIADNTYKNIANGKDCSLSNYYFIDESSPYTIEVIENPRPKEHGKFYITDSISGITKIVDDVLLKEAGYIESMEKFGYGPLRYDISNGHILLTYQISAGDGWNFPHLVFEYDFESNTLEYKLLAFPYDSVPIEIVYIG